MESNQAWAVSAFPLYSLGHPMRISVVLELVAEGAAGGAGGWFDMAVATGNKGSFCDRRGQGES